MTVGSLLLYKSDGFPGPFQMPHVSQTYLSEEMKKFVCVCVCVVLRKKNREKVVINTLWNSVLWN